MDQLDDDQKKLLKITQIDTVKMKRIKNNRKQKLMNECEKAKIELSTHNHVAISLEQFFGDDYIDEEIYISLDEFEDECNKELIPRFEKCMRRVLGDSNISARDVQLVLPIGGTCRIPIVLQTIKKLFPDDSQLSEPTFDPLTAVANGAAYYAHRISTTRDTKDLMEKLPFTIGIACTKNGERDIMSPLANKGVSLPHENSQIYYLADENKNVIYSIFVGEERKTTDPGMKCLKNVTIVVPPNTKKEDFEMKCVMKISESGLINMEVTKVKGGETLGNLDVQLEIDQLDEKLPELMHHLEKFLK